MMMQETKPTTLFKIHTRKSVLADGPKLWNSIMKQEP